MVFIF